MYLSFQKALELGERAVKADYFTPMPGMQLLHEQKSPWRITHWSDDYSNDLNQRGWMLDVKDPASMGCLLELVRKTWKDPLAFVFPVPAENKHVIRCTQPGEYGSYYEGESEAEVLVKALEAAP